MCVLCQCCHKTYSKSNPFVLFLKQDNLILFYDRREFQRKWKHISKNLSLLSLFTIKANWRKPDLAVSSWATWPTYKKKRVYKIIVIYKIAFFLALFLRIKLDIRQFLLVMNVKLHLWNVVVRIKKFSNGCKRIMKSEEEYLSSFALV